MDIIRWMSSCISRLQLLFVKFFRFEHCEVFTGFMIENSSFREVLNGALILGVRPSNFPFSLVPAIEQP